LVHLELKLDATEKRFIGEKNPRCCRFCGTTDSAHFKKVSHTLPEAIGNKCLFSWDECDKCNDFFGQTIDKDFANYLGIHRTTRQINGKNGVPKYGVPGRRPRLWRAGPNQFFANSQFDDNFLEIDIAAGKGTIKGFKQPYRPNSVFRCLVKIALAIMPMDEIHNFTHTLAWLRQETLSDKNDSAACFCFISASEMTRNGIDVTLMRRRDSAAKLPYMSFLLAFANHSFQIFLPFCKADQHLAGETIQIQNCPNLAEMVGKVTYSELDLSSNELLRDQPDNIHFEIGPPGIFIQRIIGNE
jgi:HNH endonuclease